MYKLDIDLILVTLEVILGIVFFLSLFITPWSWILLVILISLITFCNFDPLEVIFEFNEKVETFFNGDGYVKSSKET